MSTPIAIGSRRELFIDRFLIAELNDAELRLHHPRPAGPALHFDAAWEGPFSGYPTIIQDGDSYRLYYRAWGEVADHDSAVTCVAESSDGKTFERPDLGLFEVAGTRDNNVVLTCAEDQYTHNFAPFLDTRPGIAPEQRYKAITRNYGLRFKDERQDPMGLLTFASADGIHWERLVDKPVITKGKFDSLNVAFWSAHEGRYLCYLRDVAKGKDYGHGVRSIARCESDDFRHWTEPVLMNMGETPPEQLYTNQTQPYFRAPHIYIAMPGRFMPGKQVLDDERAKALGVRVQHNTNRGYWHDCADGVLLTSRGGNRYDRTFMDAFIRPGRDPRNWVSRCNYPARGIVQTASDELSVYCGRHNAQASKYVERLTLRLDGFASLHAGYYGGDCITRPITMSGKQLELNFATSAAGSLRVELQDADGQAIPGFSLTDCPPIAGDEINRIVDWGEGSDLAALIDRPLRLRFALHDADIYAFRFTDDE